MAIYKTLDISQCSYEFYKDNLQTKHYICKGEYYSNGQLLKIHSYIQIYAHFSYISFSYGTTNGFLGDFDRFGNFGFKDIISDWTSEYSKDPYLF